MPIHTIKLVYGILIDWKFFQNSRYVPNRFRIDYELYGTKNYDQYNKEIDFCDRLEENFDRYMEYFKKRHPGIYVNRVTHDILDCYQENPSLLPKVPILPRSAKVRDNCPQLVICVGILCGSLPLDDILQILDMQKFIDAQDSFKYLKLFSGVTRNAGKPVLHRVQNDCTCCG